MVNRVCWSWRPGARAAWTICTLALTFAPEAALAQHRARLSADLQDHLAAGSQTINVIVHGDRSTTQQIANRYNLRVKKQLTEGGAVFQLTAGQLAAMQTDDTVDHLSGDIRIRAHADVTAEAIGADQVWAGEGDLKPLSGKGVTVAVIDSGIDTRHHALAKQVVATVDFTGGDGMDRYGHGTHVAGLIAGNPGVTAETQGYRGIAYGAYLVNLRVLGDDGSGWASDVIEAIDWAIAHRHTYNIRVINLSLGAPVLQPYRDDPLCEAVERAVGAGITVVAAAGNEGKSADGKTVLGSITSPGNDPYVITVGALDTHETAARSDDSVAEFSSRGPTQYDLVMKPDLVAPGRRVVSAEAVDSYLSRTYPELHVAGGGPDAYLKLSGSSMSTAVVSGAAALLNDERAGLEPVDIKVALQITSSFMVSGGLLACGAGSVNVLAAAEYARSGLVESTTIADQDANASGVLLLPAETTHSFTRVSASTKATSSQYSMNWGTSRVASRLVVWGASVAWGARVARKNSSIWTASVVWGASAIFGHATVVGNSVVWGAASDGDSGVWGAWSDGDSVVWGAASDGDSVVWGAASDGDSVIWGAATDGDSVVWGAATDGDSVVWGASSDGDSVVWGASQGTNSPVVWGAEVVWGA